MCEINYYGNYKFEMLALNKYINLNIWEDFLSKYATLKSECKKSSFQMRKKKDLSKKKKKIVTKEKKFNLLRYSTCLTSEC